MTCGREQEVLPEDAFRSARRGSALSAVRRLLVVVEPSIVARSLRCAFVRLTTCLKARSSSPPAPGCRSSTAACRRRSSACCRPRSGPPGRKCASLRLSHCDVELGHLGGNGVDAQRGDLAADVDDAVVHRVAQVLAGVAQDDHPAALHHEAGERAGAAADEDGAALHVDAGAAADVPLADQVAAAQGRPERRAGVLLDDDACRPACSRRTTSRRGP